MKQQLRLDSITIAIDGYSSCGKSTLARAQASALDYMYVDSGAMYRAVTLALLRAGTDLAKEEEVGRLLSRTTVAFDADNRILLNGELVESEIRQMPVSGAVSDVAAVPQVRMALLEEQRAMRRENGIVMDGRDIGTAVFPEAELKIFLTATPEIRANRRYRELLSKGFQATWEEVRKNLEERDRIDTSRSVNPLKMAPDAVLVDNSNLNEKEQLAMVLALARERIKALE